MKELLWLVATVRLVLQDMPKGGAMGEAKTEEEIPTVTDEQQGMQKGVAMAETRNDERTAIDELAATLPRFARRPMTGDDAKLARPAPTAG